MMEGMIEVRVPSHNENLLMCLHQLQQQGLYCDVSIEGSTGSVPVHNIVLAANGGCILNFLSPAVSYRKKLDCTAYKMQVIETFVKYLYTGDIVIERKHIADLIKLFEEFDLTLARQLTSDIPSVPEKLGKELNSAFKQESSLEGNSKGEIVNSKIQTSHNVDCLCLNNNENIFVKDFDHETSDIEHSENDGDTKNIDYSEENIFSGEITDIFSCDINSNSNSKINCDEKRSPVKLKFKRKKNDCFSVKNEINFAKKEKKKQFKRCHANQPEVDNDKSAARKRRKINDLKNDKNLTDKNDKDRNCRTNTGKIKVKNRTSRSTGKVNVKIDTQGSANKKNQKQKFNNDTKTMLSKTFFDKITVTSNSKSSLNKHSEESNSPVWRKEPVWRKCKKCSLVFKSYSEHAAHMRDVHKPYPCQICDWVGHKRHLHASHMYGQHKIVAYPELYPLVQCDEMGCNFKCLGINLHEHKRCHLHKTDQLVCDVCGVKFTSLGGLRNHAYIHQEEELKYTCKVCGKVFGWKNLLTNHVFKEHSTEKLCHLCPFKTKSKTTLNVHLHNKHGEPIPENQVVHRCDVCDFYCFSSTYLKIHKEQSHSDTANYKCSFCPKSFKSQKSLRMHRVATHDSKNVKCPHCDYVTYSKSALSHHLNSSHSNARPYACPFCEYSCKLKCNLGRHIKAVHKEHSLTSQDNILPSSVEHEGLSVTSSQDSSQPTFEKKHDPEPYVVKGNEDKRDSQPRSGLSSLLINSMNDNISRRNIISGDVSFPMLPLQIITVDKTMVQDGDATFSSPRMCEGRIITRGKTMVQDGGKTFISI